jgi:hypothetical protein
MDEFGRQGLHKRYILPLHMLGLHPTLQLCCGPAGSTLLRTLRSPEGSQVAGLVMTSLNKCVNFRCWMGDHREKTKDRTSGRTCRMAEMYAELLFERMTNVVCAVGAALSCSTARIMAGCYLKRNESKRYSLRRETDKGKDVHRALDVLTGYTHGVQFN